MKKVEKLRETLLTDVGRLGLSVLSASPKNPGRRWVVDRPRLCPGVHEGSSTWLLSVESCR
jgi:hypothetical protein